MRIDDVLQRIQGEFVEMPGLRLTAAQAQRLWGLERELCGSLLSALVDAKFLERTRDGAFIRLDGAKPTRFSPVPRQTHDGAVAWRPSHPPGAGRPATCLASQDGRLESSDPGRWASAARLKI